MKNIAVREGTANVFMNVNSSSCIITLWLTPTSDESGPYPITQSNCEVDSAVNNLYYVNRTSLVILNSTTVEDPDNGFAISTAGIYEAQCQNNGNKTGAKLVVVRK